MPAGKAGSSWTITVIPARSESSASTGTTSSQVGHSRFTNTTSPSGSGGAAGMGAPRGSGEGTGRGYRAACTGGTMAAPHRIFGSELSPYSVKVRSYFRYKGIPHEWLERGPSNIAEFQKYAKLPLVPLVITPH